MKSNIFPKQASDKYWKENLSEESYRILREKGTEPRYSSKFNYNDQEGVYSCSACGTPLFESDYQYNSGSGWPSFGREIKGNVAYSLRIR
jgi:peptide-methionine (R)-S-oxide reductase